MEVKRVPGCSRLATARQARGIIQKLRQLLAERKNGEGVAIVGVNMPRTSEWQLTLKAAGTKPLLVTLTPLPAEPGVWSLRGPGRELLLAAQAESIAGLIVGESGESVLPLAA